MSIPFKKYGYELNPITNEYRQPQIFLVNKQLKKVGELYPVENLKITVNEINQADEISFSYYREKESISSPLFDRLDDLSVVLVDGYGYFETAIEKNENSSVTKSVTGISLGHAELSQILTSLEINPADNTEQYNYDQQYPTVFYREPDITSDEETAKKYRESSLLHRVLSAAPHYRIGSVSKTLRQIQRTFSWSDTDILSILNDISKEINCAFDIQIYLENGIPQRVIHVHDLQYCGGCYDQLDDSQKISSNTYKYRTIIDGVCQNCGSPAHVRDIGMDTNIFITTENLSDEISIRGEKDSIKNCFKITGGDDMITAAVQGLNMSASDRIMMFSDKQKQEMSHELREHLNQYDTDYKGSIGEYETLLETEYNIFDIKHYLRSSKMPPLEKEILTTDEAIYQVLSKISEYYNNKFYISCYKNYDYTSTRTSIRNLFTTFMPEGYSFLSDCDAITPKTDSYNPNGVYWYGTIKIYRTGNRDDSYTLHIQSSEQTYATLGDSNEKFTFENPAIQNIVNNFKIQFYFADVHENEYKAYLDQHTKYLLSKVDLSYENEKKRPWDLYSYNRLNGFYNGYQSCIEVLQGILRETDNNKVTSFINDMIKKYLALQKDIQCQMKVLLDQIFALCSFHGEYDSDFLDADGKVSYVLQYYNNLTNIFSTMINSSHIGGYANDKYTVNEFIGTKPFQCKKCGSSNVSVTSSGNVCRNAGCESSGSDIYTYLDIMQNINDRYRDLTDHTIKNKREALQKRFKLSNYLTPKEYAELRSFIREDVYKNDNYISDGRNNTQLVEHAKELRAKAEQELAKACQAEYTIDAPLSSIVGQKSFLYQGVLVNDDYSSFRINNFVRVRIDGVIYRMRIASIGLSFPVTDRIDVTFTNVTNHKGGALSDVKDIIDKAASMASSYSYIASQAEKGGAAGAQFDAIKKEGLDAALMAVKAGRDHDIVVDEHGILLRRKIQETDTYSKYQMKLIDRNLVMTMNNWETAELAIGLGMYDKKPVYGVWADLIYGDLVAGRNLVIKNQDANENCTVQIDKNGINIENGKINLSNNRGCCVAIDPYSHDLFCISKTDKKIMYVDEDGNGQFNGVINASNGSFVGTVAATNITAAKGSIGGWTVDSFSLYCGDINDNHLQLDAWGKSLVSQNGADKVVLSSGSLRFLRNSTQYMTLSTTHWKDTSIYGVGIHSEYQSKFISFGNKSNDADSSYITPLVLNYGLNPDGNTQDILMYGSVKIMNSISLSEASLTSSCNINFGFSTSSPEGTSCNAASVYWTKETFESKSSDERVKENFCTLPENIDNVFDSFDVQQYEYKAGLGRNGRYFGETSQHIENVLRENGLHADDYALVGLRNVDCDSGEDAYIDKKDKFHYIDNSNIIWLCVDQIQKLKSRIKKLEHELLTKDSPGKDGDRYQTDNP